MVQNILILGSTGAIGKQLLFQAIKNDKIKHIIAFNRQKTNIEHHKLQNVTVDYRKLMDKSHLFAEIDTVFCCLGTTMRQAGSKKAFRAVDYDLVVDAAIVAKQAGVRHFAVVSAAGANAQSAVFYNQTKGELEDKLKTMGFEYLSIFRPSLLLGQRSEVRLGEMVAQQIVPLFSWLMFGSLKKYRPIHITNVAKAMLVNALKNEKGIDTFESDQIQALSLLMPL